MRTETVGPPTPEVLIPEARQHQRRRYRRRGLAAVVGALVVAVLIVSAVLLLRGPTASGHAQPRPAPVGAVGATAGVVYFRPLLCFAPAYGPPAGSPASASSPATRGVENVGACGPSSALTVANLAVAPTGGRSDGFTSHTVAPDPQFATDPSTSVHTPGYASSTVLLPGVRGACDDGSASGARCVLGPAVLSSRDVGRATVVHGQGGQWMVAYTTTGAGSPRLDEAAAQHFHEMLGIELDGVVYSTPLVQPTQTSFSSFEGRGEISGNLTHADAVRLARQLTASTHSH